jgi:cysteine desulfurase
MTLFHKRVYADAAAATPLSKSVKKELLRLLSLYGNPSSLHAEALAAKKELDGARKKIAQMLGGHADEIIFTASGTEANNLVIFGTLHSYKSAHAITSAIEHSSVLEPLRAMAKEGLHLTELPVDEQGKVDPKNVREALRENTALVSIQMINSEIGTIQNIREIAKEIRHARKGRASPLYFHTDASQAPLWLSLNVEKLGVDLLTLDAQKILGPKGVGLLFVRRSVVIEPIIYGGGQEMGKRSGTENLPQIGAFAVALDKAQKNAESNTKKISAMRDFLFAEIQKTFPDVILHGPVGEARRRPEGSARRVANNLNISIPGLNGEMAVIALDAHGVAVSVRSACDTEEEEPSHVLKAIGASTDDALYTIRITLLPDATKRDAIRIVKALERIAARYRQKQ